MATNDSRTIDDLDRRLVERLRLDGRASNRALARDLGVNEVTVASRLRRLEKEQILRVVALTDIEAFGYTCMAFVLLTVAGRPAVDVAPDLAAIPETTSVMVATGRFDIVATVLAKNRAELARITGEVIPAIKGVATIRSEFALDVLRYDSKWSALRVVQEGPFPPLDAHGVDELDLAIIGALQQDARSSNRRIAAALDVSEGTVRGRLRRMEAEDRIKIQAVSDIEVFGLVSHAYVGIHVDGGRVDAVGKALLGITGVAVLIRSLGEFDFIAVVVAHSREELLATLLGNIQQIPHVRATETLESAATLKHAFTWARIV
jgi:DNA-binding Lrp family transcriptional regulator